MGYAPEYIEGQILVGFRDDVSQGFAFDFGKRLKCRLAGRMFRYDDAFLYNVPEGEEQNFIDAFMGYREFVGWASLRDGKLESRWSGLEAVAGCIEELRDNAELPDAEYNLELDEIIEKIKGLKV